MKENTRLVIILLKLGFDTTVLTIVKKKCANLKPNSITLMEKKQYATQFQAHVKNFSLTNKLF